MMVSADLELYLAVGGSRQAVCSHRICRCHQDDVYGEENAHASRNLETFCGSATEFANFAHSFHSGHISTVYIIG